VAERSAQLSVVKDELAGELKAMTRLHQLSTVACNHRDSTVARGVNTKVVMLHQGRIIFEGTDEQFWASTDPFIREFLTFDNTGELNKETTSSLFS
jgi:ABC-type transporter Mla maintaining outer membrane lipid asymmetry ATPase subunit MlaF